MEPVIIPTLSDTIEVVARTTIIFLYALLLLRLLGRRHLSHLKYTDVLVIIAFGSAVGDVMIYGEHVARVLTAMLAITVVAVIVKILEELTSHNGFAERLLSGEATLVIERGVVLRRALERTNVSEQELSSMLRQKEIHTIQDVRVAFLEPDGELSVIAYKKRHAPTLAQAGTKKEPKAI